MDQPQTDLPTSGSCIIQKALTWSSFSPGELLNAMVTSFFAESQHCAGAYCLHTMQSTYVHQIHCNENNDCISFSMCLISDVSISIRYTFLWGISIKSLSNTRGILSTLYPDSIRHSDLYHDPYHTTLSLPAPYSNNQIVRWYLIKLSHGLSQTHL